MIILVAFAFLAGIVTILSPCILPVLPIILSSSVDTTGKRRPLGVVTGFVLSFTFFTLFLTTLVRFSGISAEFLRFVSVFVLIIFGLSLFVPYVQIVMEKLLNRLTGLAPKGQTKHGFWGGLVIGLSLGLLWTPCVGPILASVISLALTGSVNGQAVIITFSYALGTALPMFFVIRAGSTALQKVPWLLRNSGKIQKGFGILMVATAIAILFNYDRKFQTFILSAFPNYGVGLTKLEDTALVKQELTNVNGSTLEDIQIGKPMSDVGQPKGPLAPEIIPGGVWLNLPDGQTSLKLSDLRGKVVIIDFWTYSCINCQRTFPYLKQWYEKYKDKGLVIVGVHTPEFEFEKNEKNVSQALKDFGLTYPVVQDNDFATWNAYKNRYWPAKYIIDKDGVIRYTHFGEGGYDETEKVIQDLLMETGAQGVVGEINNPQYQVYANTPETYLGFGRIENFVSSERIAPDKISTYSFPSNLSINEVAYKGSWMVSEEYANPQMGSQLLLNFDAKEVFLVMRTKGEPAKVKVFVDDEVQFLGEDVKDGVITIDSDRLYKLINLPTPGNHILRLEFEDANAELFAFTFG